MKYSVIVKSNIVRTVVAVIEADSEDDALERALDVVPHPGDIQPQGVESVEVLDDETIANTAVSADELPPDDQNILIY